MADIKMNFNGPVSIGTMFDIHDNAQVTIVVPGQDGGQGGQDGVRDRKADGEKAAGDAEPLRPAGGIEEELRPIFKNNAEEAAAFVSRIDGAKPTAVTEEVNSLLRAGKVTRAGSKRDLWRILHAAGYYRPSESNWNAQVNA